MWIVKGVLLGSLLAVIETIAYICFGVYRNIPPSPPGTSTAVDLRVFPLITIHNPLWWAVIIATLVIACSYFKTRQGRG